MSSLVLYFLLILAVSAERIVELFVSKRNAQRALDQGGREFGQGHFGVMKALHTAFLFACPLEVWLLDRPFTPWLGWTMLAVVIATMSLRYWAISTLGERWNTRVLVVPGLPAVTGGPYRWIRHPNYVAVVLELAALPLIHGAWITALVFSVANFFLLRVRIQCEEDALRECCSYEGQLGDRPRFLPSSERT